MAASLGRAAFPPKTSSRTVAEYKAALELDPCSYCGGPATVLDHVQAKSRGGTDAWWNLAASCDRCNFRKHARSLVGFLGALATDVHGRLAALQAEAAAWKGLG